MHDLTDMQTPQNTLRLFWKETSLLLEGLMQKIVLHVHDPSVLRRY